MRLNSMAGTYGRRKDVKYPICADGNLSCPPEDCGGTYGYYRCIRTLKNQDNEEGRLDWLGDWEPDNFDPGKVRFEHPRKRFLKSTEDV